MSKMIKIVLKCFAICLLVGLGITGCAQNHSSSISTEESTEEEMTVESTTEESSSELSIGSPATEIQTGTLLVSDAAGYKVEITIRVSQLIKGTDKEKLNHEWQYFGKDGEFEDLGLAPETSAYIIGTVSYANRSDGGFSLTGLDSQTQNIWLGLSSGATDGRIMYSKSPEGLHTYTDRLWLRPKIVKDTWGPVTFILGKEGFFTPADPEGTESLQDISLKCHFTPSGETLSISDNFQYKFDTGSLPLTASW